MSDLERFFDFRDWKAMVRDVFLWLTCLFIAVCLQGVVLSMFWVQRLSLYLGDIPETVKVAFFTLVLITLFVSLKRALEELKKIFYKSLRKNYFFSPEDWSKRWIYNGRTRIYDNSLYIHSSRAGCLLKDYYWKNFEMSFEVRFDENSRVIRGEDKEYQDFLGIIFRAQDFDNYFMIQLGSEGKEDDVRELKVWPKVRYRAGWEDMVASTLKGVRISSVSDRYTKIVLLVKNSEVFIKIDGQSFSNPFWSLPTHVDVNHVESGVRDRKRNDTTPSVVENTASHVREIPFRLDHGMIGFRSHSNHTASIIRNLRVKRL